MNKYNQSLESFDVGKNQCFHVFIKAIQLKLIPKKEVFIDDIIHDFKIEKKECIIYASIRKKASQRVIVNNKCEYGDQVVCYVDFKVGGSKSHSDISIISLKLIQKKEKKQ